MALPPTHIAPIALETVSRAVNGEKRKSKKETKKLNKLLIRGIYDYNGHIWELFNGKVSIDHMI